jgi:hypothetical protein
LLRLLDMRDTDHRQVSTGSSPSYTCFSLLS